VPRPGEEIRLHAVVTDHEMTVVVPDDPVIEAFCEAAGLAPAEP
jgi:hypothetical protein